MGLEATTVKSFKFERGAVTMREGLPRRFEKLLPNLNVVRDRGPADGR
jgi:hypothetical protein